MASGPRLTPLGVDGASARADAAMDPDMLRLENLDTDLRPPRAAIEATHAAVEDDAGNSYLPFRGNEQLRRVIAEDATLRSGVPYDAETNVIVTAGGTSAILTTLLATINPGDEVVLTDPVYVGIINRVRLARGVPRFVPLQYVEGRFALDIEALERTVNERTRIVLAVNPSMPSGAVATRAEWSALATACIRHDALLVYDAALERIVYDDAEAVHPASLPEMASRTVTIGSASKQCRMIGWRVGWIVAPAELAEVLAVAASANVVTPVGIAQSAVAVALREPEADFERCVREWESRRNVVLDQLSAYRVLRPQGGWCALLDTKPLGIEGSVASRALFEKAKVAVTPMTGWGSDEASRYIRIVFSNEPSERLAQLRDRFRAAFGI